MPEFIMENLDYVISIFTTLFAVCGMQFKNMKVIIFSQLVSNGLLAAQCIIGGTMSTGGVVILGTVQTAISFVFAYKKVKFPAWLTLLFMAGFTAVTVIGFISPDIKSSPFDLLTMVAAWFFAVAMVQEKSWICRGFSMANLALWLTYDIIVLPSGIITHVIIIGFTVVSIIRNDREEWSSVFNKIFGKKKAESLPEEEKKSEEV